MPVLVVGSVIAALVWGWKNMSPESQNSFLKKIGLG